MKEKIFWAMAVAILFQLAGANAQTVFVSPEGKDANEGTIDKPFATLEKARDHARTKKQKDKPITIFMRKGVYELSKTFILNENDGGTDKGPVLFKAYKDEAVVVRGSKKVGAQLLAKPGALASAKLQPRLKDSIFEVDLPSLGIRHANAFANIFNDDGDIIELFMDNERMPLSRYPNIGNMAIKKVLVNGGGQESKKEDWANFYGEKQKEKLPPRPGVFEYRDEHTERWLGSLQQGIWLKGFWRIPWQNEAVKVGGIDTVAKTIKLAVPVPGGIGNKYTRPEGNGKEPYYALNLLEEIDMPGEWAIDFPSQKLYFYPPSKIKEGNLRIADIGGPLVQMDNASHVVWEGIVFEENLGEGISVRNGRNNKIAGCTVRNVTKNGIVFDGGFGHTAQSNDVHYTGAGGIWLRGGDETAVPRKSCGFIVDNNHVHDFARLTRVYAAGINAGFTGGGGGGHHVCVGAKISHNRVHGTPHVAVLYGSYDNKFEYNEVYGYCQFSDDMGAFYCYDKYERMGHDTLCYNFIHNSPIGDAIYFDNDHPDMQVYGNIIALNSAPKRRGTAYLFKIGSQAQNPQSINCFNNIAVNCNYGYQFVSAKLQNDIHDNVTVNCGVPYRNQIVHEKAKDTTDVFSNGKNLTYTSDPGFVNMARYDFRLRPGNQIEKDLPGFQPIPFEKIGLYVDGYRKKLPTDAESNRWEDLPSLKESTGTEILDRK